jgi:hypothetical protein
MDGQLSDRSSPPRGVSVVRQILSVGLIAAIWFFCRWTFGASLAGSDDSFYVRYAHLMHRAPINHWEGRSVFIWSLRFCFLGFGYSEYVSWVPGLFSSVLTLTAVAWLTGWPRRSTWQGWSAMLLAATIPVDVIFSNYPVATSMAAGFLSLGTAALIQESTRWRIAGAALLSFSFIIHEYCLYFVAISCLVALAFDFRSYLKPVAICVGMSLAYVLLEGLVYYLNLGQATYRFRLSAAGMGDDRIAFEAGGSTVKYFLMPIQQLLFNRSLGIDLIALFSAGLIAIRSLSRGQRLLFVIVSCYWLWAGYGPMTPWEYKPPSREIRLLFPYVLAISYLLPSALSLAFSRRVALLAIGLIVSTHLLCLASGGRWEQASHNARELLDYAAAHPQTRFVTDLNTINQMYIFNDCSLPENIVCISSPRVDECLLVNREPEPVPIRLNPSGVTAFLHNREADRQESEPGLKDFLSGQIQTTVEQKPRILKPIFRPISRWLPDREIFVLNDGWEVVELRH